MAEITTGASSNEPPAEGFYPLHIINVKHQDAKYGPQLELHGRLDLPDGPRTFKRWLSLPKEGPLPKDHAVAQLAGVVLFGTPTIEKGTKFNDEDSRFMGATVLAQVRHYEKGEKSKNPGAIDWTYEGFSAFVVAISEEVAAQIRGNLVALFGGEAKPGSAEFKSLVSEFILENVGRDALVGELNPEEAAQLRAAIKVTAKHKKVNLDAPVAQPVAPASNGSAPANETGPVPAEGPIKQEPVTA